MPKIDQQAEKRIKNEEFALKHRKRVDTDELDRRKRLRQAGGRYANWCRHKGHPPECKCEYKNTDPRQ